MISLPKSRVSPHSPGVTELIFQSHGGLPVFKLPLSPLRSHSHHFTFTKVKLGPELSAQHFEPSNPLNHHHNLLTSSMASQKQKATSAAVNNEYDYTLQTYGIGQPFFSKHVGSSTAPTKGPEKYQKLPESPEDDEAARKAEVLKEAWAAGYRHLLEQAAPGEKWECPNPDVSPNTIPI